MTNQRLALECVITQLYDPNLTVEDLASILSTITLLQVVCANRLSLDLSGVTFTTGPEPEWVTQARCGVEEADPDVVNRTCQLISEVNQVVEARATLEVIYQDNQSHIRVVWEDNLVWVVSPTHLPWPGVSVRVYDPSDGYPKTLYLAYEVVKQSLEIMGVVRSPMRYQADFILHTNKSPGAMVVTAVPSKTLTPKVLTNGDDFIWSEAIELAERNGYERDEARRECAALQARAEKAEAQLKLMRIG